MMCAERGGQGGIRFRLLFSPLVAGVGVADKGGDTFAASRGLSLSRAAHKHTRLPHAHLLSNARIADMVASHSASASCSSFLFTPSGAAQEKQPTLCVSLVYRYPDADDGLERSVRRFEHARGWARDDNCRWGARFM